MVRFAIEPAPLVKNEDDVIHVAKRWLEFIVGDVALNEEKPDSVERRKPDVDRTFIIKDQKYALEHTCIEAFPKEFESDGLWSGHFGSQIRKLENELNSSLLLSHDLILFLPNKFSVNKKDLVPFLNKVKNWIISQAGELGTSFPGNTAFSRIHISGRSYRLKLGRYPVLIPMANTKGLFKCIRVMDSDEAKDRRKIVEKAFHVKAEKLSAYKKQGIKAVLVMEWRYRIPTPYSPIICAHEILKDSYSNAIDMVILVGIDIKEWAIKYTETNLKLSRKELMENWWLYDWDTDGIKKYTWS